MKESTKLAIFAGVIVVVIITGIGIGLSATSNLTESGSTTSTTSQTSTGTDYFSLSCQQLQAGVNQALAEGDYGSARQSLQVAQIYLQIMQLKGCNPS